MIAFAQRLKELRKAKKVTQQELSEVLGYGSTAVANYESGRNEPSLQDLVRIADFFDISLDNLLGRAYPTQEKSDMYASFDRLDERKRRAVLEMMKLMQ
ncbi:MAG: helix-turn-helix transcriptional regulator [Anaerotignum sp.]|nr:helix-turn-helix transcriptional regulator [Anaerotignum sp.]